MADLISVGPGPLTTIGMSNKLYVEILMATDPDPSEIDARITSNMTGYADKTYVDSHDALLATQAYINTQDNQRLHLDQKDIANGIPGLRNNGRVDPARINPSTLPGVQQRRPSNTQNTAANPAGTASGSSEVSIGTFSLTSPGYAWRALFFGILDGNGSAVSAPLIRIRHQTSNTQLAAGIGRLGVSSWPVFLIPDMSGVGASAALFPNTGTTAFYLSVTNFGQTSSNSSAGFGGGFGQHITCVILPGI